MASSSSNRPTAPATPAEVSGKPGAFIDWGPALPESYGGPRILALVRDPRFFFATWEEGDQIRAHDLTTYDRGASRRPHRLLLRGTPEPRANSSPAAAPSPCRAASGSRG
jgi:hypothetical protein